MGPFDRWPSPGNGFEHFYGFIGGETNQYAPAIYRDTVPVEPDRTPEEGYHFTEDMTDQAIDWVRQQKALMPDKPFFVYFAPGATHAPHHVPTEWSAKYKGTFDDGWDALRERTFARQKELGVIPPDAELTARRHEIPAWDDMPDDLKPVLARQMEVYAGFMEHTDHHVGRLIDALADLEILDDTLVYAIIGDNGASAEGTPRGTLQRAPRAQRRGGARDDRVHGGARSTSSGRRRPTTTTPSAGPTRWTRRTSGPSRSPRTGAARATARSSAGRTASRPRARSATSSTTSSTSRRPSSRPPACPHPTFVNGIQQAPLEGVSMAYTFDDADAADRHTTQYFEMFVNRGIYHQGWTAVTRHSTPWVMAPSCRPIDDDVWELYGPDDWTQAHDLAAEQPDKLAHLQRLFLIEAGKYNVLPLDDRRVERFNPDLAGRPQLIHGNRQILFGGMGRLSENSVLVLKNKSHAVTAEVDVPDGGANGTIVAQGGAFGGWTLYAHEGRPAYCYNLFGLRQFKVYGDDAVPAGEHQVRVEFAYDGGGLGKGGTADALRRRHEGRRGPRRRDRADGLLGRRDDRRRQRHRHAGHRRLRTKARPTSTGASAGSSSTSARTPRTPTT